MKGERIPDYTISRSVMVRMMNTVATGWQLTSLVELVHAIFFHTDVSSSLLKTMFVTVVDFVGVYVTKWQKETYVRITLVMRVNDEVIISPTYC